MAKRSPLRYLFGLVPLLCLSGCDAGNADATPPPPPPPAQAPSVALPPPRRRHPMPAMQPPAVPAAPPAGPAGGGLDLSSLLQEVKPFLQGNSQDTTTSTTTTTTTDATAAQYNKDVAAAFAKIQAMTPEQRAAFVPGTAAEKDAWAQYQTNVGPGHFNR